MPTGERDVRAPPRVPARAAAGPPGLLGDDGARGPTTARRATAGPGGRTGKAAVITGADSGIGRAVAIAYAREGADVLITYLDEDDDAEETAKLGRGSRAQARARRRATSPTRRTAGRSSTEAVEEFGAVDVLVSNAAFQMTHESLEEIPDEEWDHTFATNLSAMFHLVKAARAAHASRARRSSAPRR